MTLDAFSQHPPMPWYAVQDGELVVGGRRISAIAADAGRTPLYLYDRSVMTRKVEMLRAALPSAMGLHYAIKANPLPGVVNHLAGLVDGLDVASAAELDVALATSVNRTEISFAGPGKTIAELERAVAAGIIVNMESTLEMRRLADLAVRSGSRPRVAVRVNPDFELKSSGMKMAGGPKQFG